MSDAEMPPLELTRYIAFEPLGSGGMATVYLAQRRGTHTLCALKILHERFVKHPTIKTRFLKEAQVTARLSHPNIAKLLDAGWDGNQLYISMELIRGQTLFRLMRRLRKYKRVLSTSMTMGVALDVLNALQYAHELTDEDRRPLSLVHRDMSPNNVMVTYDGKVKIIDFGLVRADFGEHRTKPGAVIGTLRYMSPEQAKGQPVDVTSDLYTWMATVYEMLVGAPLVSSGKMQEVLQSITSNPVPSISTLVPSLPSALDEVFTRALAKSQQDRFASAADLKQALTKAAPELVSDDHEAALKRVAGSLFESERITLDRLIQRFKPETTGASDQPMYAPTRTDVARPDAPGEATLTAPGPPAWMEDTIVREVQDARATLLTPSPSTSTPKPRRSFFARQKLLVLTLAVMAAMLLALLISPPPPSPESVSVISLPPAGPDPTPRIVARTAVTPDSGLVAAPPKRNVRRPPARPTPARKVSDPGSSQVRQLRRLMRRVEQATPGELPPMFERVRTFIERLPPSPVRQRALEELQLSLQAGDRKGLLEVLKTLELRARVGTP